MSMGKIIQFPTDRIRTTVPHIAEWRKFDGKEVTVKVAPISETTVSDPMVGVKVFFTGDMYNSKGYGKIAEVNASAWGTSYHVIMDEGEDFWLASTALVEAYEGMGNNIIVRKAVYEGYRAYQAAPKPKREPLPDITRDEAIKQIREGLKRRTGRSWSVTGGKGTAWGWIRIDELPRNGSLTDKTRKVLAKALGLESVGLGGESIPASSDYWWEFIDRANGRTPRVYGRPYWD
jgi:hypothetical protein